MSNQHLPLTKRKSICFRIQDTSKRNPFGMVPSSFVRINVYVNIRSEHLAVHVSYENLSMYSIYLITVIDDFFFSFLQ